MMITHPKDSRKLYSSQVKYIKKAFESFSLDMAKPIDNPFTRHFKLSINNVLLLMRETKN